jgi:hypothetical protein
MLQLTRRRSPDAKEECWQGDVRVGTISKRVGIPNEADRGRFPGVWRDQEVWPERKYATWRRGERMPSQKPNSLLPCPCGQVFDSHRLEETVVHVPHITALAAVH